MSDPEISVHADRASAAPTRPPPAFDFEEPPTRPWNPPAATLRRKPPPLPPRPSPKSATSATSPTPTPTPSVTKAIPSTFPKYEPVLETAVALTEKELPLVVVQNDPSIEIPFVVASEPLEDAPPEPPPPPAVVAPVVVAPVVVAPIVAIEPVAALAPVGAPQPPVEPTPARPGTTTVLTARRRTAMAALESGAREEEKEEEEEEEEDVEPTWLPRKRRWRVRLALLVVLVAGEVALANRTRPIHVPHDAHELAQAFHAALATPPSSAIASDEGAVTAGPAPIAAPEPTAGTDVTSESRDSVPLAAAAANLQPGMGVLDTTGAPPNRRIFVDDRTVGQTPRAEVVACGAHKVQIGSAGHARTIDVPCGAAVRVDDL